ncbi:Gag-Pol polyprotein [Gossypium australe]|uniref:Gag-Pol polyprotein n=1 Tax=Gossypium australe TaxID=47621 RepID=A0A5B6WE75_9ROSI|nr:Gag-Pol polyprotein [Gossypium australe]
MDLNRAVADNVESNVPAPAQRTASSESRNVSTPQCVELLRANKPQVDKIRKYGAEEFRATVDDDPEIAEFWLENTIRIEFRKKYISQQFLDQKHKEFLELKLGRMTVAEYEREFYAREYVSSEKIMCKQFVDGLNEDIKLLVRILELKEFVVLVDRACKAEELSKEREK